MKQILLILCLVAMIYSCDRPNITCQQGCTTNGDMLLKTTAHKSNGTWWQKVDTVHSKREYDSLKIIRQVEGNKILNEWIN